MNTTKQKAPVFQNASITPNKVTAASNVEYCIRLEVGKGYTGGPSRLVFDCPTMLGTSRPNRMHREYHGYVQVVVSNPNVTYTKRIWHVEMNQFITPEILKGLTTAQMMAQRHVVLDLSAGLQAGDVVEMYWGYRSRGYGAGCTVTGIVPTKNFKQVVDVLYYTDHLRGIPDFGKDYPGRPRPVPDAQVALPVTVKPDAAVRLRLIRGVREALLIPYDRFWNVADTGPLAAMGVSAAGAVQNDEGTYVLPNSRSKVSSRRLPLEESAPMTNVFEGNNIYWGDLHSHSYWSIDTLEREKLMMMPRDLMRFARYRAGLDVYAVSDHHSVLQPDAREYLHEDFWEKTMKDVVAANDPGKFLVIPAFEFRCARGDTVVYLSWQAKFEEIALRGNARDIRDVWKIFRDRNILTIPHFHNQGSLPWGEWFAPENPDVEPCMEFLSCHGNYELETSYEDDRSWAKGWRSDRSVENFLASGRKFGFFGDSDGHKGTVGTSALTAFYAPDLSVDAIFGAARGRHTYATTNARIRLLVTGNGRLMGSVVPCKSRNILHIDAIGEGPLKAVELYCNGRFHHRFLPEGTRFTADFKDDSGEPGSWYVRVVQQDNQLALASPIWFE